jgi:hypothetical protein
MKAIVFIAGNLRPDYDEAVIIVEDGGMATIENCDGRKVTADYYQDRISGMHEDIFEKLAEGKMYWEDYEGEEFVTEEMIMDALDWLVCPFPENFEIEYRFFNPEYQDINVMACEFVLNSIEVNL